MDLQPNILQHLDCVVVPRCVFFIRLSLLRRRITTWSADREGWLYGKAFCCCFSSLQPYLRPLILSSVSSVSLFVFGVRLSPFRTSLNFPGILPCCGSCVILSTRPTIFYLLLLFIISPFAVVIDTICWFYFIILFVQTQQIFLASTFVLNHC